MTIPSDLAPSRLDELVEECLVASNKDLIARSLDVTRQIVENLPEQAMDRTLIREAIGILVAESIRHAARTSRLRITVKAGQNVQMFAVKNSGEGFARATREKLFSGEIRPGTLARARAIIAEHGGATWANSMPGRGTTYYFTLPGPTAH